MKKLDKLWGQITEDEVRTYVYFNYICEKTVKHDILINDIQKDTGLSKEKIGIMCDQGDVMYLLHKHLIDSIYPNYPEDCWTESDYKNINYNLLKYVGDILFENDA